VPSGHAVLTLRGLDIGRGDRMAEFCLGYAVTGGRHQIVVDYGTSLFDSYVKGAAILEQEIRDAMMVFDRVTVMAHSKGAVVAGKHLLKYAGTSDPGRLDYLLLGNPGRRLGGDGKSTVTPDATAYQVSDVSRRWDRHSNSDNWPGKPGENKFRLWIGSNIDHGRYEQVDHEAAQLRAEVGNTRYLIAP
jgi:hypothetical protein